MVRTADGGTSCMASLQDMGVGLAHVCHTLTRLTQESDKAAEQANQIADESVSIRSLVRIGG
jgi:hypothetical protein